MSKKLKFNEFEEKAIRSLCEEFKTKHGYSYFSPPEKKSDIIFSCRFYYGGNDQVFEFNKSEDGNWRIDPNYTE